ERWFTTRGRVVYGEEGRPGRVVGIAVDITERKLAEEAVRRVNEMLEARVLERTRLVRALASRLTLAEQAERQRLAEVLHDDLQQQLFGLSVLLGLLPDTEAAEDRRELHARAAETLAEATALTRSLATELSPPVLASDRLADLLHWLADRKRERYGLAVEVLVEEPCVVPDRDVRVLLYRVVREALFNVVKHAGTARARITARRTNGEVEVVIEDEGRGFDPAALAEPDALSGFGMANTRERVRLAGGRIEVATAPGQGTRVTVVVPVHGATYGAPHGENP
ncbi:MAG TPA: sensor histidine kinase, partial [Anaeromyxobacteraceae bacterium]|nr:sensor histidine kinase [Anaeromyxobacteraceae bacterium]